MQNKNNVAPKINANPEAINAANIARIEQTHIEPARMRLNQLEFELVQAQKLVEAKQKQIAAQKERLDNLVKNKEKLAEMFLDSDSE